MQKIIGVTELQRRFRSVFDDVSENDTPYILMRGSRPEAALIPYEEFLKFQAWRGQDILREFDWAMARLAERNAAFSDEEIEADVEAAIAEVRSAKTRGS